VYVREAHPGENYPAHTSLEQKLRHAGAFRDLMSVQRPILVDDMEGTGHHLYGALPNMTYIVNRAGTIIFRSDWTDPPTIQAALDYFLAAREKRREGMRLTSFYAEIQGYRWNDPEQFMAGLQRNGPLAVEDFRNMSQRRGGGRAE